ncbi:MAG: ribonuclease III [Candidatus Wildermuthbacteria bacterium]|nr:ribonuclease III [Candidatus Wildermuthbacteria bacterium]
MSLSSLEKALDISFKNKDLLQQAFVHRSYLNENRDFHLQHNERLEFLGDAVLELVVTEYLYSKYPDKPEGELTAWRAALVNTKMLSSIGRELNFSDYLLLSHGESKEEGKARDYILANTVEAFIGALFLDQGLKNSGKFITTYILSKLKEVLEDELFLDSKSHFQELAQEKAAITPTYIVLKEWGPDHAKHFYIGVYLDKELVAHGEGSSKQEAEQNAAKNALAEKNWK